MREPGYYFVKTDHDQKEWEIARWDNDYWWLIGTPSFYYDGVFDIVGDKINMPE